MAWIIAQLPEKPKTIALMFASSIHGWKLADWKARCIGSSQTITLFKSTKGKTAGGYLHIQWQEEGGLKKDDKCFLFSLDKKMKLLPMDSSEVTYFDKAVGPVFGLNSLTVQKNEMMNAVDNCNCNTKGRNENFNVPEDELGNSILTGDGQGNQFKRFILAALETYVVTY